MHNTDEILFTAGNEIKVSVTPMVPVQIGESATLPCWLDPPQSAEPLEVYWSYRGQTDSSILAYKERKIVYAGRNTQYEDRVSFGTKDPASGGLASGDVSLHLVNVTLKDAAEYTCHVSSNHKLRTAVTSLAVYSK